VFPHGVLGLSAGWFLKLIVGEGLRSKPQVSLMPSWGSGAETLVQRYGESCPADDLMYQNLRSTSGTQIREKST